MEMTTPPPSTSAPRTGHRSPKKRKLDVAAAPVDNDNNSDNNDDHDNALDPDATPRSSRSQASSGLAMRFALPAPPRLPPPPGFVGDDSTASTASASTASVASSTKGSRRSASPVKNIAGLQRLDKPVLFGGLEANAAKSQLPRDAQQLYHDIYRVTKFQQGLFPPEIRRHIEAEYDGQYHPDSVYRPVDEREGGGEEPFFDYLPVAHLFTNTQEGVSTQSRIAHAEFYRLCAIRDAARQCLALRRAEASWNSLVHEPLLHLALASRRKFVVCENATSARILPCFQPSLVTGEVAGAKMVDFALAPNLASDPDIDSAIQTRLLQMAKQMKSPAGLASLCVNQTDYNPLARFPTAITVETKVGGGNPEEGRMQLGIWTAAWHKRMETLGVTGRNPPLPLPTLPLILTHDHEWSLYFAVDRLERIDICGPMPIGMTDNIPNIYQLLAVLRLLVTWIETEFRPWIINAFVPPPT
ncbi:hypothetical protein QBC39DRAFT_266464 [Podospora conica]|nr:hypothetical protein QBC39DRAFT_266464 [Schizothecium conicum]